MSQQWGSPCGSQCTNKYAALGKIPCLEDCNQICYKDPVLKDQQWSAYIDRSPGAASYSEFEVKSEEADKVCPNRQPKPETKPTKKPKPQPVRPIDLPGDIPDTSA
ncbi:hypothetical protein JHK85_019678 [Glycine max]|nr:hypothetical protein JHK85_019678 [Glycine max]